MVFLAVAAVLLASRDLMKVQARAVGQVLDSARVPHRIIDSDAALSRLKVGKFSRSHKSKTAASPVIEVQTPAPQPTSKASAVAMILFTFAAILALTRMRPVPAPVKGFIASVLMLSSIVLVYQAWGSGLAPVDVRRVAIDWRHTSLIPIVVLVLLFAFDLYPIHGNFVIKTAWAIAAVGATAVFSTVRLALVVAGYAKFGPSAFLYLHQVAGVFWDLIPGIAILAAAHASVAATQSIGPTWIHRRWL